MERYRIKLMYVAKPVTRTHTSLDIRIYIFLKETTKNTWQSILKSEALWNITEFFIERNLTNLMSMINFIKNLHLCGHERIHIRWKCTNVSRTLSINLRIHHNQLTLDRNMTNVMKVTNVQAMLSVDLH